MGKSVGASGYKGVRKYYSFWRSYLPDETHLGYFDDPKDAAIYRDLKILEYPECVFPRNQLNFDLEFLKNKELPQTVKINSRFESNFGKYIYKKGLRFYVCVSKFGYKSPIRHSNLKDAIAERDEFLRSVRNAID
ncbi:hypothetical protein [Nostoc phage N1]|nr:hypothetical protein [Nostoc phage N1]